MNSLTQLKRNKGALTKRKEVGRGNGSGHGSSSTRGGKGQTARTGSKARPGFEGGQTPLFRKMPKLRGFNNYNKINYQVVNVGDLNVFEDGFEVTLEALVNKGLVPYNNQPLKILGTGDLTKKLTVKADKFSTSAKEKIEKLKGACEVMEVSK